MSPISPSITSIATMSTNDATMSPISPSITSISTGISSSMTSIASSMGNRMVSIASMVTIIGDLSHISLQVIGVVADPLETTIRKVDRVMALTGAGTISTLSLVKPSSSMTVSYTVLEAVGDLVVDLMSTMVPTVSTNDPASMDSTATDASSRDGSHQACDADEDLHTERTV